MIKRIVKLQFKPENIDAFVAVFEASKHKIRNSGGCMHLELLQDIDNPNIFFTYSFWNEPTDLEKYRNSDLFKETWIKTKALFEAKPYAWSVIVKSMVDI